MLSISAISDAAISALPIIPNFGAVEMRSAFVYQVAPYSAYRAFVADESIMKVYAVEITMRPLTDLI